MSAAATASQLDEFQDIIERMDRIMNVPGSDMTIPCGPPYHRAHSVPGLAHRPPLPIPQKQANSAVNCNGDNDYVRVNIGIDEDLKMILDMDPSLIDDPLPNEPVDKFLGWPAPTNW